MSKPRAMPLRTRLVHAVALGSALVLAVLCTSVASAQAPDTPPAISAAFPFESKYVEVLGSRMHYVDVGTGDPVLFLHGNPTSSYLWRNVIPYVQGGYRAIAVDLIGMGKSDKPDLAYTYQDHRRYVDAFIEQLGLRRVTLVVHDWGSVLGLDYAMRHESNVVGVAFMEAIVPPAMPTPNPPPPDSLFGRFRTPGVGEALILDDNVFVEQVLPGGMIRTLTPEERDAYRAPYATRASRLPTLMWPRELPMGGEPARNAQVITSIGVWMGRTTMPMLHLWARPGALNGESVAQDLVTRVKNLQSTFIGPGRHYVQEDQPEVIGRAIADWRRRLALTF